MTSGNAGGDQPGLSWPLLRELHASAERSAEWHDAALLALDVLENELGTEWPAAVEKCGAANYLVLSSSNAFAFARLLELALRLHLLRAVPGMARVRKALRYDPRLDELAHAILQLEVAALASRDGFELELEPRTAGVPRPPDVRVGVAGRTVTVEAFASFRPDRSVAADAQAHKLSDAILAVGSRHGVSISGDIHRLLSEGEMTALIEMLERTARVVSDGTSAASVVLPAVDLIVGRQEVERSGRLSIHLPTVDLWARLARRLLAKAEQSVSSRATWLRLDVLDALWLLTPFGRLPLIRKIELLVPRLRELLAPCAHLEGVVVSDGAATVNFDAYDETVETTECAIALRRRIDGFRTRETIIVPLRSEAAGACDVWRGLYAAEPSWLPWALGEVGLSVPPELSVSAAARRA